MRNGLTRSRSWGLYPLWTAKRCIGALFEESTGSSATAVAAFSINADRLEKSKTIITKKAFGIPFHISDAEAVDRVCRYHQAAVELHGVERYLMPFWLVGTSACGTFRADLLQRDPAFLTQQHCLVWIDGPRYEFSYPFGDFHPFNQVSASYVEPLRIVESCVAGTHVPSMLISRFELLEELERMPQKPKVLPFTLSTATALSVVEKRITRKIILNRVDQELQKLHGSFVKSNITMTSVYMEAVGIRPVFLPVMKLMVSTSASPTPVPAYVCGATGKVVGPVLHLGRQGRWLSAASALGLTLLTTGPVLSPELATAASLAAAAAAPLIHRGVRTAAFLRDQAQQMAELKSLGVLNFGADTAGYRWTPEDEEKDEYEYREELRRQARRKESFEQRVKDDAARDQARAEGRRADAKGRRRADIDHPDPLGFYAILGLKGQESTASAKEIAAAFRTAVRAHHPDVNRPDEADAKKTHLQEVISAYRVLQDSSKRKLYDSGRYTPESKE